MRILDVCVGAAKIYQGMQEQLDDNFVSIDIRKGDFSFQHGSMVAPTKIIVKPTIIADMRYLPFQDGVFDGVVADPPHLDCGLVAFMGKAYGSWDQHEIIAVMKKANLEIARVLREHGSFTLKIMNKDKDRYLSLLKNFVFYLPVQTFRVRGCMPSKESKNGAIWLLGIKKEMAISEQEICVAEPPRQLIGERQ